MVEMKWVMEKEKKKLQMTKFDLEKRVWLKGNGQRRRTNTMPFLFNVMGKGEGQIQCPSYSR